MTNISFSNEDTTHLQYSSNSNWFDGSFNASNTHQNGTLSTTKDNSANVTFIFPQAANAVYYYGIRRCCGGFYAVCVDCDPNDPITNNTETGFQTIDAVNTSDDGRNPPVVLWSTVWEEPGIHTILLTNQLDNRFPDGNSQITVASFDIQVGGEPGTSESPSPEPTPTPTSFSTGKSTSTATSAPTTTQTTSSSEHSISLKLFLGAFLGGLAILAGIIAAVFLCIRRRRRRKMANQRAEAAQFGRDLVPTPFTAMLQPSSSGFTTSSLTVPRILQKNGFEKTAVVVPPLDILPPSYDELSLRL